jgi:hypothetical protein
MSFSGYSICSLSLVVSSVKNFEIVEDPRGGPQRFVQPLSTRFAVFKQSSRISNVSVDRNGEFSGIAASSLPAAHDFAGFAIFI